MPPPTAEHLTEHLRRTLLAYDEGLLRTVAAKLCRPRNQWPAAELVERVVAALGNAAMLDRRLKDLPPACRQLLALASHGGQSRWPVGFLVEMLVALGQPDGLAPVLTLLESGLLLPELFPLTGDDDAPPKVRLKSFETWLAHRPVVIVPPLVADRLSGADLDLPPCPGAVDLPDGPAREADGLEWPLRLAVLWQQTVDAPIRRTQQRDLFKRDLERLRSDPMLSPPPTDGLAPMPDPGLFTVALAQAAGLLSEKDAELQAAAFTPEWQGPLPALIAEVWQSLPLVQGWNPAQGWQPEAGPGNPYPAAQLLALLLLSRLPEGAWADPQAIADWLGTHHPYWKGQGGDPGTSTFLLTIAYPLRLLQARQGTGGKWLVRLSPLGRWVLGLGDRPAVPPAFPQTLLVQPTLEILAYRQGLTPALIITLTQCATWKGLGPACTLQLDPGSVYRALEAGQTLQSLVQTLERHGMKALPPAVLDSLKTWSNKRERITIYPSAALFEFASAAELTDAIARGLPAQRLTDRLAVVATEKDIDYRHFRLTGTRDYCLPAEKCVEVEADGVTLSIDLARSDLLLETEVQRFAEPAPQTGSLGRRHYRLTPASVAVAREQGATVASLERWFEQRTGSSLSAAARLLLTAADLPPPELRRQLVLHVADEETADGIVQWPGTRALIQSRLGPTALVVQEEDIEALTERLKGLGVQIAADGAAPTPPS